MKITSTTPKYPYHCEKDVFLGQTECEGQILDWYLAAPSRCPGASCLGGSLISQYGEEPDMEKSFPVKTFKTWKADPNAPYCEWIDQGCEWLETDIVKALLAEPPLTK